MKIHNHATLALSIVAILILAACVSIPAAGNYNAKVDVTGLQVATPVPAVMQSDIATAVAAYMQSSQPARTGGSRAVGDTNITNLVASGNGTFGGDVTITGAVSANAAITNTGYLSMQTVKIAPTATATATPAMLINNTSAGSDSIVVANAATPVWKVGKTGTVTGYVLQYGSSGKKIVCSSQTITGTGTLATGLATPQAVIVSMNGDPNYDHMRVTSTNASVTVVAKVWNGNATPVAAATAVTVDWCAVGTPP